MPGVPLDALDQVKKVLRNIFRRSKKPKDTSSTPLQQERPASARPWSLLSPVRIQSPASKSLADVAEVEDQELSRYHEVQSTEEPLAAENDTPVSPSAPAPTYEPPPVPQTIDAPRELSSGPRSPAFSQHSQAESTTTEPGINAEAGNGAVADSASLHGRPAEEHFDHTDDGSVYPDNEGSPVEVSPVKHLEPERHSPERLESSSIGSIRDQPEHLEPQHKEPEHTEPEHSRTGHTTSDQTNTENTTADLKQPEHTDSRNVEVHNDSPLAESQHLEKHATRTTTEASISEPATVVLEPSMPKPVSASLLHDETHQANDAVRRAPPVYHDEKIPVMAEPPQIRRMTPAPGMVATSGPLEDFPFR